MTNWPLAAGGANTMQEWVQAAEDRLSDAREIKNG